MLRVLIVAVDASDRHDLGSLIEGQPGFHVIGQVDPDDLASLTPSADVVVWDLGSDAPAARRQISGSFDPDVPLVLLGPRGLGPEALRSGALGYLQREADGARLAAALQAAAHGLQVVDAPGSVDLEDDAVPVDEARGDDLTPRELDVLQLLAEGLPNKEVARRLQISENTVKFHVNTILSKLGARTRTEAVTRAARQGLIVL